MQSPDHIPEFIALGKTVLTYGCALLFIYCISKMSGKSPLQLGDALFKHFLKLADGGGSLKSLNARIELLGFFLIVFVFASPLKNIFIPEVTGNDVSYQEVITSAIIAFLIAAFVSAGIICVWFCRHELSDKP